MRRRHASHSECGKKQLLMPTSYVIKLCGAKPREKKHVAGQVMAKQHTPPSIMNKQMPMPFAQWITFVLRDSMNGFWTTPCGRFSASLMVQRNSIGNRPRHAAPH
jgi:hypothetical protein